MMVATFEDIKAGARLRRLDAAGVAEVVQVTRFGPDALNGMQQWASVVELVIETKKAPTSFS